MLQNLSLVKAHRCIQVRKFTQVVRNCRLLSSTPMLSLSIGETIEVENAVDRTNLFPAGPPLGLLSQFRSFPSFLTPTLRDGWVIYYVTLRK